MRQVPGSIPLPNSWSDAEDGVKGSETQPRNRERHHCPGQNFRHHATAGSVPVFDLPLIEGVERSVAVALATIVAASRDPERLRCASKPSAGELSQSSGPRAT